MIVFDAYLLMLLMSVVGWKGELNDKKGHSGRRLEPQCLSTFSFSIRLRGFLIFDCLCPVFL